MSFLSALSAIGRGLVAAGHRVGPSVVAGGLRRTGSALAGAVQNPFERELHYRANAVGPSLVPSAETLYELYYAGRINAGELRTLLSYLGIPFNVTLAPGGVIANAWNGVARQMRPGYGLELARLWYRQDRITAAEWQEELRLHGYGGERDRRLITDHRDPLTPAESVSLYAANILSFDQARDRIGDVGHSREDAELLLRAVNNLPSPGETIALMQRGEITAARADDYLRRQGFTDISVRQQILSFARVMPTVSDLVHFLIREGWDRRTIDRFQHDAEFPPEMAYWGDRLGIGWRMDVPGVTGPDNPAPTLAQMHWRTHWQALSPTQAFEMHHRYRGDPADPATWSVPGVPPFTIEDVDAVLKQADYAPGVRPYLRGLSYRVLRLVDINNSHRYLGRGRDWLIGKYLDRGQTPSDAAELADLTIQKERARRAGPVERVAAAAAGQFVAQIGRMYRTGIIVRSDAERRLIQAGMSAEQAALLLDLEEMRQGEAFVKALLRRARSDWNAGRANLAEIRKRLVTAGIAEAEADRHIMLFRLERGDGKVQLSVSKTLELHRRGLIPYDDARYRLYNLGHGDPDVLLLLQEVQLEQDKDRVRLIKTAQQEADARRRKVEQLVSKQRADLRRLVSDMRRDTPVPQLLKWAKDGIWTVADVVRRMRAMAYTDQIIASYLASYSQDQVRAALAEPREQPEAPDEGEPQGNPEPPQEATAT